MVSKHKVHKFLKNSCIALNNGVSSATLSSYASDILPSTKHFQPILELNAVE